jgi:hypothetical protein
VTQELVVFQSISGATRPGQADDVARYSEALRITIGVLYIVGGLLGGTACIVVPIVHLVSTWALPLCGILLGLRAFKRRVVVCRPAGICPSCNEPIELVGGSIDDLAWQVCPRCGAAVRVRPNPPACSTSAESAASVAAEPDVG